MVTIDCRSFSARRKVYLPLVILSQIKPFHAESTFRESVRESVRNLRHIGEECITDRLQTLHSGSEEHTRLPKDMLTYILQMFNDEDGGDIKIDEMVDQLITFFIAGKTISGGGAGVGVVWGVTFLPIHFFKRADPIKKGLFSIPRCILS